MFRKMMMGFAFILVCASALAAGTSIWNASSRGAVASTDRLPVATSGSSGPLYVTPETLKAYIEDGGIVNTNSPVLDLTQGWLDYGDYTALSVSATGEYGSGSRLIDLKSGTTSVFSVALDGTAYIGSASISDASNGDVRVGASGAVNKIYASGIILSASNDVFPASIYTSATGRISLRNAYGESDRPHSLDVCGKYTDASNYECLRIFGAANNTPGTAVTIGPVSSGTGSDNLDLVMGPFGAGSISAHLADSTTTGGDVRGDRSVDWQLSRDNRTQVASGVSAVIAGGNKNTASGEASVVSGGVSNTSSAQYAFVGGGYDNISSGDKSAIGGGYSNRASGEYSWIPGGLSGDTRSVNGTYAYGNGSNQQTFGGILSATTSDNTPTVLISDSTGTPGTSNMLVIPTGMSYVCAGHFVSRSATDSAAWKCEGLFENDGGTVSMLGSGTCTSVGTPDSAMSGASLALSADDENDAVAVTVTSIESAVNTSGELKCSTVDYPE